MNFEEARKALLEGKKVRRKKWLNEQFIFLSDNLVIQDKDGFSIHTGLLGMLSDEHGDWEVYDEPVKPFMVQALEWFKSDKKTPEFERFIVAATKTGFCIYLLKYNKDSKDGFIDKYESWAYWEYKE